MSHEGQSQVRDGPPRKSAKSEPVPTHNPDPLMCSYYVLRKHRFCRTECRPGSRYCCTHDTAPAGSAMDTANGSEEKKEGSHISLSSSGGVGEKREHKGGVGEVRRGGEARVPCPINPNHTVYASRLERHVKVCPDLRFVTAQLPYFSENKHANQGAAFVRGAASALEKQKEDGAISSGNGGGGSSKRRTHRDLSADELAALISKVETCYHTSVEGEMVVLPSSTVAAPSTTTSAETVAAEDGSASPPSTTTTTADAPIASSAVPHISHAESASQKHGPQHTALLRCLSDVVLQSLAADSILSHYAHLPSVDGKVPWPAAQTAAASAAAAPTPSPIHIDGFLEFGAGKGGLSVALQQLIVQHLPSSAAAHDADVQAGEKESTDGYPLATESADISEAAPATAATAAASWRFLKEVAERPPLVVLDMDGFRRKGDARVRHSAVPLQRLRINIKDVHLTQAFLSDIRPVKADTETRRDGVVRAMQSWAVLGKHLCGACTDFALSCLTEAPSLAQAAQVRLPVVVIATCCHHRCELVHLNPPQAPATDAEGGKGESGAPMVLQMPGSELTWSPEEVAALTSMTSWAVCGGFVDETRRRVGWQCKRILDQMRVHFLRRLGYIAFQCQYTTREVTEENVCLVAFQPPA